MVPRCAAAAGWRRVLRRGGRQFATAVPELHAEQLTADEFGQHFLVPSLPVLIRGVASGRPAVQLWAKPAYLEAVCGADRPVICERNARGRVFSYGSADASVTLPLSEVLTTYGAGGAEAERMYVAQTPIDDLQPDGRLREDIDVPAYCDVAAPIDWAKPATLLAAMLPVRPPPDVHMWLGHTTSVSPLHFDAKHNLLTQCVGHKRVSLFAPECSNALYAEGSSNQSQLGTVVDLREVCPVMYPRFAAEAEPQMQVCTIGPGDALYIPGGWWHHVAACEGEGDLDRESPQKCVISVNFWWV